MRIDATRIGDRRLWILTVALLLFSGCGTGEYSARLQDTLANKQRTGAIDSLLYAAPSPLDDKVRNPPGVSIRLPALFDGSANNEAGQPPVTTLPGFWYGMERIEPDSEGKPLAVYIGFGWVPKAEKKAAELQKELMADLAKKLPNAAWKDAKIATPDGPAKSFKMLSATGAQDFKTGAEEGATANAPGEFRLYIVPAASDTAFVVWRGPSSDPAFWKAVEASMGSVSVEGGDAGGEAGGDEAAPAEDAAEPAA